MKSKITVIIVTFNGSKWLNKMLVSVINSSIAVEILIVDNASTDDSVAIIESFSQVQLIKSKVNLGFGKANNIGIKLALEQQSDYIFLLNQDTWVFTKSIETLVNSALQNPEMGILSPRHLCANETDLDENFNIYYQRKIRTINSKLIEVPFVNAAAWLISKQCFEKIGLFEPIFNHYGEDRNFCDRLKYHGFKVGIVPTVAIVHDRVISRNFKKDVSQSQYKILNAFLDINTNFAQSSLIALQNVFGLPKFFYDDYPLYKIIHLWNILIFYFLKNILNRKQIMSIRTKSKKGINGL